MQQFVWKQLTVYLPRLYMAILQQDLLQLGRNWDDAMSGGFVFDIHDSTFPVTNTAILLGNTNLALF